MAVVRWSSSDGEIPGKGQKAVAYCVPVVFAYGPGVLATCSVETVQVRNK